MPYSPIEVRRRFSLNTKSECVPPIRQITSTGLRGIVLREIILSLFISVRFSNANNLLIFNFLCFLRCSSCTEFDRVGLAVTLLYYILEATAAWGSVTLWFTPLFQSIYHLLVCIHKKGQESGGSNWNDFLQLFLFPRRKLDRHTSARGQFLVSNRHFRSLSMNFGALLTSVQSVTKVPRFRKELLPPSSG